MSKYDYTLATDPAICAKSDDISSYRICDVLILNSSILKLFTLILSMKEGSQFICINSLKMLETVLLDLMVGAEEGSVCEIVYKSLGSMGRNDLIEIFTSRNCGNPACVVHSSAK